MNRYLKFAIITEILLGIIWLFSCFFVDTFIWAIISIIYVLYIIMMTVFLFYIDREVFYYTLLRSRFIDDECKLKELDENLTPFKTWWYTFWYRRD